MHTQPRSGTMHSIGRHASHPVCLLLVDSALTLFYRRVPRLGPRLRAAHREASHLPKPARQQDDHPGREGDHRAQLGRRAAAHPAADTAAGRDVRAPHRHLPAHFSSPPTLPQRARPWGEAASPNPIQEAGRSAADGPLGARLGRSDFVKFKTVRSEAELAQQLAAHPEFDWHGHGASGQRESNRALLARCTAD
eukprot:2355630-Prymnesium_polylepis.2